MFLKNPIILYILSLFSLVCLPNILFANSNIEQLIIFGDSLSDTGRGYQLSNNQVPPSPPYFKGRFSNGPLWVEYIARDLGISIKPENNYALPGAISGKRPTSNHPMEFGFLGQVEIFEKNLKTTPIPLNSTLILILIGGNDFQNGVTPEQSANNIEMGLKRLEQLGATKILLGNVPPAQFSPLAMKSGTENQQRWGVTVTKANTLLSKKIATWMKSTPVEFCPFNITTAFKQISADPARFGFNDLQTPCLRPTNPTLAGADQMFWWDDFHPTTKGHQVLAQAAMARFPVQWKQEKSPKEHVEP
jgi:phospholipase/lecithinase/hemolysin